MANLRLITPYFKRSSRPLLAGFLALVVCDLGQMLIPGQVGKAIDCLAQEGPDKASLALICASILGLALLVALLRYAWRHRIYGFSRRLERDLRSRLHARFLRLSLSWHQENSSGDLMALATNDIESVRMSVGFGLVSLVDALALGLSAIAFMLAISPALCFWAFLPLPLITGLTALFGQKIYRKVLASQDVFGELTETVREHVAGFKVIRAMALEDLALGQIEETGRKYMARNVELAWVTGAFFPFLTLLTNLALALTLYFGGRSAILGDISPGSFVAFITYLALLTWPLMAMGLTTALLQQGLASLDRLARVLEAKEAIRRPRRAVRPILPGGHPGPPPESPPQGPQYSPLDSQAKASLAVRLEGITFRYPGREEPALRNLSLEIGPGELCALAGPTGSGKSTLAALLPALWEPQEGAVVIGGRPGPEWPLRELRSHFGFVPQDGYIFTGTVLENLCVGRTQSGPRELERALGLAGLPMDPAVFPQGLHTLVGERGLTLSGGQRQRLALARALLADPPFLILDDTLSAVDAATEEEILGSLIPARQGRSTLIISHRVTSLSRASRILVLEGGRLTADGPFQAVSEREGWLKRICQLAQAGAEDSRLGREWAKSSPAGRPGGI